MVAPNWKNKSIFTGDNLYVMRGMNSESVDLIYLDPPFNSNRTYAAPIGSKAAGAAFKDTWTLTDLDLIEHHRLRQEYGKGLYKFIDAVQHTHSKGMFSYLIMMATRLVEMSRILKPTGSIYLHCDPTASHYLKQLMDAIFGRKHFRNEIVWCYRGMTPKSGRFNAKHDVILYYTKSDTRTFNPLHGDPTEGSLRTYEAAMRRGYNANHARMMVVIFDEKKYRKAVKEGVIPSGMRETYFDGGKPRMLDWWADIKILGGPKNEERIGFPTQKPLALLERILKASSKPGDVVFDPFCGCATTLVMADRLQRDWIGIDISPKAVELLIDRVKKDQRVFKDITASAGKPKRTDLEPELTALEKKAYKGALFALQEQKCNGCNTWFSRLEDFEMDHITPISHGGTAHRHNFQLLCGNCNRKKGSSSQEEFMLRMQKTRAAIFKGQVEED